MIEFHLISEQPETLIVLDNGVKAGQITKISNSLWQAKGRYFTVELSNLDLCKACFHPETLQKQKSTLTGQILIEL